MIAMGSTPLMFMIEPVVCRNSFSEYRSASIPRDVSRDREEIKTDLKDGKKEFKLLHQNIDRSIWALKLPPEKEKDEGDGF